MLMESIVRKTPGIKDRRVVKVEEQEGLLLINFDVKRRNTSCFYCDRQAKVRDRLTERAWQHVPW